MKYISALLLLVQASAFCMQPENQATRLWQEIGKNPRVKAGSYLLSASALKDEYGRDGFDEYFPLEAFDFSHDETLLVACSRYTKPRFSESPTLHIFDLKTQKLIASGCGSFCASKALTYGFSNVLFSPNSNKIFAHSVDKVLYLIDLRCINNNNFNPTSQGVEVIAKDVTVVTLSTCKTKLAYSCSQIGKSTTILYTYDVITGKTSEGIETKIPYHHRIKWAPDSKKIVVWTTKTAYLFDLSTPDVVIKEQKLSGEYPACTFTKDAESLIEVSRGQQHQIVDIWGKNAHTIYGQYSDISEFNNNYRQHYSISILPDTDLFFVSSSDGYITARLIVQEAGKSHFLYGFLSTPPRSAREDMKYFREGHFSRTGKYFGVRHSNGITVFTPREIQGNVVPERHTALLLPEGE